MRVQDIEIPLPEDRHGWYRFFEILPGALSLLLFLTPIILSFINVKAAAAFIIIYVLALLVRASAMSARVIEGYSKIKKARKVDWEDMLKDFYETSKVDRHRNTKNGLVKSHINNINRLAKEDLIDMLPDEVVHVVMIAVVLAVLWLLGFLGNVGGNLVHILLLVAVIVIIYHLLTGRRAV